MRRVRALGIFPSDAAVACITKRLRIRRMRDRSEAGEVYLHVRYHQDGR